MARVLEPTSIAFEIVFDEDQAKLGGLPVFGFAARMYYMRDCYQPPDEDPDFEELAERGREAITAYLDDLCRRFDDGGLP
jgi:hypothetical protein